MELIQQFHDRDLVSVKALFFIFWHLIIWQEFDFLYGIIFCNQSPNVYFLFRIIFGRFFGGKLAVTKVLL